MPTTSWNKGIPHKEETKKKISESCKGGNKTSFKKEIKPWNTGKKCPQISEWMKGNKNGLGVKRTEEVKKKMSERMKGRKISQKLRDINSKRLKGKTGEQSMRYIKDRTQLKKSNRHQDMAYIEWSKNVKIRDDWKCKINNKDCCGRLESHHILGFTKFPELRYDINNGITLCVFHHPRSRIKEKELSPYFQNLILNTKQNNEY